MSNKNSDFKPYIPADRVVPEFTVTSVLIGILLAIVFGGANAYLGLRVGMTISASIPAAVISMGVIRVILRRDSILENNMVQTIGSAGESVAAGAIFTLPALFLWAKDGIIDMPGVVDTGSGCPGAAAFWVCSSWCPCAGSDRRGARCAALTPRDRPAPRF